MAFSTTVQIPSVQAQGPRAEVSQKRLGIPAEQYVPGCQWCSFQLALVMPVVWALLGWLAPYWVIPPALQRSVHMDGHWPLLSWLEWHWAHERHPRHQVFWTLYLIYTYIYIFWYADCNPFWYSLWQPFLHSFWHSIWIYLTSILTFFLAFYLASVICSDVLSGILSDILSGIVSGTLFGMCSGPGVAHCILSWEEDRSCTFVKI